MARTATAWPEPNTRVDLVVDWWPGPLASRVEDQLGRSIVVAGPTTPGAAPITARPGAGVRVTWLTPRGPASMAGVISAADSGARPSWTVAPSGTVRIEQRRDYARVPLVEPLLLTTDRGEVAATMVDLSEGGMSCVVFVADAPAPRDTVQAVLAVGDTTLSVVASVVRAAAVDEHRVVLATRGEGLTTPDADRIRREVFEIERRRRGGSS